MDQRLRLHYSKFCGLARTPEFRTWLKSTSSDLEDYLAQASPVGGCKARADRMVHVYNRLYETGKGEIFENFIKERFPYVIDKNVGASIDPHKYMTAIQKKVAPAPIPSIQSEAGKALDIHGVFKIYKPDILTFPQKRIIVNSDRTQLDAQVNTFVMDKFGVDTLIIGDRAYIEYFEPRYKEVVSKIHPEKRDIYQYKQRNKNANHISS